MSTRRIAFTKGHGTGNDFVLLADPRDEMQVTPEAVRAVCDRRFGIGADGLIRVVPDGETWFMDYHNADGSIGEMCGNGARVFAAFLHREGLVDGDEFGITTRTIRFYEDHGLLSPARKGRNRVYGKRDVVRLKLTLRGKRLGLPLTEYPLPDARARWESTAAEPRTEAR